MLSQNSTAQRPSFSRTWSEPVPKLSSPHRVMRPASSRLPKNFQPVGVSKQSTPSASATRSAAWLVGMERATPAMPALVARRQVGVGGQHGEAVDGVTKKPRPRIMLRSPSPSEAAPKSGASAPISSSIRSWA
jgi:hypothetical protein